VPPLRCAATSRSANGRRSGSCPSPSPQPSGSLEIPIDVELPPEAPRPRTQPLPVIKVAPVPAAAPDALDATIAACRDIDEVGWLFDVLMAYVERRWRSSALFDHGGARLRGHGPALERDAPDAVQLTGAAAPFVLVVGDPIDRDPDETAGDLAVLAEAASVVLART